MAQQDASDRQLPATERKIRKAREEGQVARSRDLGHVAMLAGGAAALFWGAPWLSQWSTQLMRQGLQFDAQSVRNPALMTERLSEVGFTGGLMLLALGAVMLILALLGGLGSGGWNWTLKAIAPKFSKLNPIEGLPNLISAQQLVVTLKACGLALLVGTIGGAYLYSHFDVFSALLAMDLQAGFQQALSHIMAGCALMLLAVALFALVDVPLQHLLLARRLRMSHQEVKQEHKEAEGNPEVKVQLRHRMREMSRRRMMAAVPTADLVVMNPTHYAVALKYDEGQMGAPRVVAKGTDLVAMRIRDLARESEVPVLQAPPLARALYAHTEIDQEVPAALFTAVAQVLAWVYQLRAAQQARRPAPPEPTALPVPDELDPHHPSAQGAAGAQA